MAFYPRNGRWGIRWYAKTASVAYSANSFMAMDNSTGYIIAASATTDFNLGILLKAVASTDSDYASNTRVPVQVPLSAGAEFEADVTAGTLVATSVGKFFDFTDGNGIDQGTTSNRSTLCTRFISATKGMFVLNTLIYTRPAV